VCVCACTCVRACACVRMCVRVRVSMCVCVCVCACAYMLCVCLCVCIYVSLCLCVFCILCVFVCLWTLKGDLSFKLKTETEKAEVRNVSCMHVAWQCSSKSGSIFQHRHYPNRRRREKHEVKSTETFPGERGKTSTRTLPGYLQEKLHTIFSYKALCEPACIRARKQRQQFQDSIVSRQTT
jgi:hypothetical protein